MCGHLFGLNFPIEVTTSGDVYHTLVSVTGSKDPEEALTDADFRNYLSAEAYTAWMDYRNMQGEAVDNGWKVRFNEGHAPVGSFESFVASRKLNENLSGDFEVVYYSSGDFVLTSRQCIPVLHHTQQVKNLLKSFGVVIEQMDIIGISSGEARMMPYWWAYKYNVVVCDRESFLKWIKGDALKIWENLSQQDKNHCHRASTQPGHEEIEWGFWENSVDPT